MLPVVSRASEHAPAATACCNACRTCVQTNLLGIAVAGLSGGALAVRRLARRLAG